MSSPACGTACTWVLLAGLPGTGKTTLAKALAECLHALQKATVILNKDDVRAALFPGATTDFSQAQNALCMDAMLTSAAYLRSRPAPPRFIFFDGRTFSRSADIDHVVASAASGSRSDWCILHLTCTDQVAEQRLDSSEPHPAADRGYPLYLRLKAGFEPITRPHLTIDTTLPFEECVTAALDYLTQRPAA